MVHRGAEPPVPVSEHVRTLVWVVFAYAATIAVIAGCLLGNRVVIAAGSLPACLVLLVWTSRKFAREIMGDTHYERAVRDAVARLEARTLPVRGFGGEIIEGARAVLHADERGVSVEVTMPAGAWPGVRDAIAGREVPAMSFGFKNDTGYGLVTEDQEARPSDAFPGRDGRG